VPSENVLTSEPDRRTRKRTARRDALLDLAADVVERDGIDGLTMAALAEAADYATASLYTYFSSRSELLAALQQRALAELARVAHDHLAAWDAMLAGSYPAPSPPVSALAKLWAFSDLFLAAPEQHPREFRLQQQLLVTPGAEETQDAASVVPAAMLVLEVPRQLLAEARDVGALEPGEPADDPVGQPLDPTLVRTFAWVVAMNGALMVDGLTTGLPSTGRALGQELTASLLRGWGAAPGPLAAARELAHALSNPEVPR
jgi:AcrR family transcriptional regulator